MDKVKKIIAHFIKIDPSEINHSTIIDYTAVEGSIIILRMYSKLAESGYNFNNIGSIQTYGDLLKSIEGKYDEQENEKQFISKNEQLDIKSIPEEQGQQIGIDIENISNILSSEEYKTDQFYIDNFSSEEIKYCESKKDPLKSFLALFSLKESIVKADNSLRNIRFNQIIIEHDSNGKPIYPNFNLSVSHSDNFVVSVAVKNSNVVILSSLL